MIPLLVVGFALVIVMIRTQGAAQARRLQDAERELSRRMANLIEEVREEQAKSRRYLAMMAAGEAPTREMIEDGTLFRDVSGDEARRLVDEANARVLDVRTASEVETGAVPGALRIPIEELPRRTGEVPDDGRPLLVYCAGGARSAAACELLGQAGHRGALHNLAGGVGTWPGPLER